MIFDRFVGPSYSARSPNVDCERSMNVFAEAIEGGAAGKARLALYGTPGLLLFANITGKSQVRAIWANDTSCYGVIDNGFYQIFSDGTFNLRGTVANDGKPAKIMPNGNEVLIVSGGFAYVDAGLGPVLASYTTAFTGVVRTTAASGYDLIHSPVTWLSGDKFGGLYVGMTITIGGTGYTIFTIYDDENLLLTSDAGGHVSLAYSATPSVAASSGAFLNSYYIIAQPGTRQINVSAINDGSTWDPLDFASKEGYPDHIAALLADHEELWIFGTDTTEVWGSSGTTGFPLQRIESAFIHHGCSAPASPARLQSGVAWLSGDAERGGTIAYLAQGFMPNRISTHAEESAWDSYSTVADAVSFTYTEGGHEFWVIIFPTANATWVFDATSGWWHERGHWNGSSIDAQLQICHASVFGKHLVGDRTSGKIYQQSLSFFDDDGTQIVRIRTAPHLSTEQLTSYYSFFQLDMELGQSATTPSVALDWSDDGGHTFHSPKTATPTFNNYGARVVWRRLGRSVDRVFRVTITAAVKVALIQAILDVKTGSGPR